LQHTYGEGEKLSTLLETTRCGFGTKLICAEINKRLKGGVLEIVEDEISVVIISGKQENKTLHSLNGLPDGSQVIVSTKRGLGFARNFGASCCTNSLMVQFDDDLEVEPEFWSWLQNLKSGEFAMATVDGVNPATRVFAVHLSDFFKVGGFNPNIKYIYEDWEFFRAAVKHGLRFKMVPNRLYIHIQHTNRNEGRNKFKIHWESARIWAKYPAYSGDFFGRKNPLFNAMYFFFKPIRGLDFKVFLVRFIGALYWMGGKK
jgi:glycosyltransferase involved in cell wall biosynthesis